VAVIAARCGNKGSGGDKPAALSRCEADLSAYVKSGGSGVHAKYAANNDLLAGEAASGRAGDVLLANDRIQVLIEQAGRTIGPQPYGGNIIDADIVRPGEPARDRFGELGAFFQLGRTVRTENVEILQDGSSGGAAVVAATGKDDMLDFIHVAGLLKQYGVDLPIPDADKAMNLRITTYYVLNPGESSVRMVEAFCNDGDKVAHFPVGDLVDSGGQVGIYAGSSGFAKGSGSIAGGVLSAFAGDVPERFGAWIGPDVAYGYIPATDQNQMVTISGVTATVVGGKSILDWTDPDSEPEGAMTIPPGQSSVLVRDFVVARDAAGIFDRYYQLRSTQTGTLTGVVKDSTGAPVAGVRVVALQGKQVASLFTTDANGRFSGTVPTGAMTVQADDDVTRSEQQSVTVAQGETKDLTFALPSQGTITVKVRNDAGQPIPGKVTVVCSGACPTARADDAASLFRDAGSDALPTVDGNGTFDIRYLDPSGDATIRVPAGAALRVYLSRGLEWSLFQQDVTVESNETVTVEGQLKHVVDSSGWMSGDFHVHAINSPDSPVANTERLRSFMAEGVDVLVSTDHDYITDLNPWLAQIPNGSKHLKAITGVELTTFDYGHYNGFPMTLDPAKRNGGAVDWATGDGHTMTPGDIFQALDAFPGEQVVQINHPLSGMFSALGLDTRTLWTRNPGSDYRIRPVEADAQTGDTRLWDPTFTAMEIANGTGTDGFTKMMNNWMSLLSRGVRKTGTAVSDTHKRHGDSGYPRTYVLTGSDDAETMDVSAFVHAVNQGKAFGTSGPFLKVTAQTANGTPVNLGETLVSNGQPVTVNVEARFPEWMDVNSVAIYANSTGTETDAKGAPPKDLPTPTATPEVTSTVENGVGKATATAQLTLNKDAWIIVVVRGTKELFPVVGKGGDKPFAFSNPIFVDVDGQGWTPPVDLAAERARVGRLESKSQSLKPKPSAEELRHLLGRECREE
jgi:hypothetical protein